MVVGVDHLERTLDRVLENKYHDVPSPNTASAFLLFIIITEQTAQTLIYIFQLCLSLSECYHILFIYISNSKVIYINTANMRAATLLSLIPLAAAAPHMTAKRDSPAPVLIPRGGNHIDGKYIVRMKKDVVGTAAVTSAISSIKADADYEYKTGFSGFAATLEAAELESLRNNPSVSLASSPTHRYLSK
jgi:hypothetical protein